MGSTTSGMISANCFLICCFYVFLNLLYSFYLKKILLIDIIILTCFYLIRVFIGFIGTDLILSPWLIIFIFFFFFSLSALKRHIDITLENNTDNKLLSGRKYQFDDKNFFTVLGISSGIISVFVLLLYTMSDQVQILYQNPLVLLFLGPGILYWICRLWLLAQRECIKDDPIVFAIKDINSYIVLAYSSLVICFSLIF